MTNSQAPNHETWLVRCSSRTLGFSREQPAFRHFCARSTVCTKPHAHTRLIICNTTPKKDTMIIYISQSRYPLKSQVLLIFFPFATIPAMPHYPEFTDRCPPQYGMLRFLLHFMTNTYFFDIPLLPPICFHLISQSHSRSSLVPATIPDPTYKILVTLHPSCLSHSPDLGCVGAQRIMFLCRFLV